MVSDGLHPNISDAEYRGPEWADRMSPSVLEYAIGQTMAHVKAAFDGKMRLDTKPLRFGRAAHCRILEPERFKTAFAMSGQCEAFTRDGKGPRCSKWGTAKVGGLWACSTHSVGDSEVEVYSPEDFENINGIIHRLSTHPVCKILKQSGGCECTIAWTCHRTGVKCKTKLDKWMPAVSGVDYSLIVDLKCLESADPESVSKAVANYGFARAAAMRMDGIEALTGKRPMYCLICVEKKYPFEVTVPFFGGNYGISTMRGSLWDVRTNLQTWANCVAANRFPGYSDDFIEVETTYSELLRYKNCVPSDFGETNDYASPDSTDPNDYATAPS